MNLVLDFGNTHSKLALFSNGTQLHYERVELSAALSSVERIFAQQPGIKSAILSSVVDHASAIESYIKERCPLICLNPATRLPIINAYATPATLGRDRLAAAVGLWADFPKQNALSIDAGTCITFDLITADSTYRGGAISPGVELRFKALHTFTDHLPLIPGASQAALVGDTTESSMQSGVMNGVVAEVQGIVNAYRAQYPGLVVVLTGGDFKLFENALKNPIFADPNLVLKGLNSILAFNDRSDHS